MPDRLQLSRKRGFRLPLGAKSVARPHRFGNPFVVWKNREWYADIYDSGARCMGFAVKCADNLTARRISVLAYEAAIDDGWRGHNLPSKDEIRANLAGLSLACWCPLPEPGEIDWCHAATLLSIANGEGTVIDDRRRRGMTTIQTGVTRDQLLQVQAHAERAGLTGDALREVLAMICQPPRVNIMSGNNRRVV